MENVYVFSSGICKQCVKLSIVGSQKISMRIYESIYNTYAQEKRLKGCIPS